MTSLGRIFVTAIPHLALVLCLVFYVPWVLGIPGDPNAAYADGWYLGYYALNFFIAAYAILALAAIAALLVRRKQWARWAHRALLFATAGLCAALLAAWVMILN